MSDRIHADDGNGRHDSAAQPVQADVGPSEWEPNIIVFLCSWCGYTGADGAGAAGFQYPANVRILKVPCAGRVNPMLVIKSLQRGADGAVVIGCPPGRCHYTHGNLYARRRLSLTQSLLEFVGVDPGRVRIAWVGATEGKKFAQTITETVETVRALGPLQSLVKRPVVGPRIITEVDEEPTGEQIEGRASVDR